MPRGVRAAAARARTRAPRARARLGGSAGGRIDLLGLSRRLGGAWCMHEGGAAAPRGVVGMGVDRQGRRSGSETPGSSVPGCQAAGRLCCAVGSVPCTARRRLVPTRPAQNSRRRLCGLHVPRRSVGGAIGVRPAPWSALRGCQDGRRAEACFCGVGLSLSAAPSRARRAPRGRTGSGLLRGHFVDGGGRGWVGGG